MSETFGVSVLRTLVVTCYIKAEDKHEAWRKAGQMDGVVRVLGLVPPPVIPKMDVKWPRIQK